MQRRSCWSCVHFPIHPQPFKCRIGRWAHFPDAGAEQCNAYECTEAGTDEVVAVEERVIEASQ